MFPVPRTLRMTRKYVVPPDEIDILEPPETVMLHRLIRHPTCPYYEPICAMDERIKDDPTGVNISDKDLKDYRRQIAEAEKHFLMNANVVLCTCTESESKRISKATNIQQVKLFATCL